MLNIGWDHERLGNDDCALICAIEYPEENWHHVLDEDGGSTGDLYVDDLDYLKSYEFYWLERNPDTGSFFWLQETVSEPSIKEYLKKKKSYYARKKSSPLAGKHYHSNRPRKWRSVVLFSNESTRVFKSWHDCFLDLTHHVAFCHLGAWETSTGGDAWGVFRKISRSLPFRLFCEPHVLQVIRSQKNSIMDIDHELFTFGKVYDLGLMKILIKKFGAVE